MTCSYRIKALLEEESVSFRAQAMSTRVSDKAWLDKLKEKLQPQTEAFYVLLFDVNGEPHIQVGYTGQENITDRDWKIQLKRTKKVIQFQILLTMPKVRQNFGIQKSDLYVKTVASIESAVKAILDRDVGPAVKTVLVNGEESNETYKCGAQAAFKAVTEVVSIMEPIGTGLTCWPQWRVL